jgi:hypothetical protein
MLGRFVVPASRLPELSAILLTAGKSTSPWQISSLVGKDFESDLADITVFNLDAGQYGQVHTIEMAPELQTKIEDIATKAPRDVTAYFELPLDAPLELLKTLVHQGARAKVRTGGLRPEAIPSTSELATFIVNCASAGAAFKATAGLHHPIRSIRPLTYEPNAIAGEMHGFLNVLMASAFAISRAPIETVNEVLAERQSSSFLFTDSEVRWKGKSVPASMLREIRQRLFISFGSCSFDEPVEDLVSLGWL